MKNTDSLWMNEALDLAAKAKGFTSPNPCVGAVLVKNQKVIGRGYHRKAGTPHAEVLAVRDALRQGISPRGSTLYVTLEPCCSHGRTPPCTDLIIREKIKRVVMGTLDPNPAHAGRAPRLLKKEGIEVTVGILKEESSFLNRDFNHWIVQQTPWVTLKSAMSYDGRITRPTGESSWLTGESALEMAHELRGECDAILVGAETVRKDNPQLTVRHPRFKAKTQPWRVILTRSGKISSSANLLKNDPHQRTLIYQNKPLQEVLKDLGNRGVMNLLVEGGGEIHSAFLSEGLAHEVAIFWAPMMTGTSTWGFRFEGKNQIQKSIFLKPWWTGLIGNDLLVRALVQK
ncbi:MAG: bifunctional diaminohydroxyphosphoribosylaminopyrimidine deaminase/5-amino-6-(5-phosphoribosylamino)uracil reductase RibD [Verrucomicrobiota bacterium]